MDATAVAHVGQMFDPATALPFGAATLAAAPKSFFAFAAVLGVGLEWYFLPEDQSRGGLRGLMSVSLAFLRAIDAVQPDAFGTVVVQDFDGVAVEDGGSGAGEVSRPAV